MAGKASVSCKCGRVLDWTPLQHAFVPTYNASIACEACGTTLSLINGSSAPLNQREASKKSAKGKGKEAVAIDGASEKYNYGRMQMVRPRNRFVYNPYQGYEMEAPKYSGMLLVLGREWWVPDTSRMACSLCAAKFDLVKRRHHCRACGEVVCKGCSPKTFRVAAYEEEQRVCNQCLGSTASVASPPNSPTPNNLNDEWRERFFAIQSSMLYLRLRPVLEESAKGYMPLETLETCEQVSDVTLKAEAGVPPPPAYANYCFKATFKKQKAKKDKTNNRVRYFCAKSQELMNSWIVAIKEAAKEKKEQMSKTKAVRKKNKSLVVACKHADAKKVKEYLKQGADPTYIKKKKTGITALMKCAKSSKSTEATLCATLLLQEGTTPNAQDHYGRTALHFTIIHQSQTFSGDDSVMDMLLRYGADLSVEEQSGLTPVEFSAFKNVPAGVSKIQKYESSVLVTQEGLEKMLQRGGNINWRDSQGSSLVHRACMTKKIEPLKFLIEHRTNINVTNLYGQAAIHVCCISNFEEGIRVLLEHKANVDIQDNMGYTPLHVAVMFNSKTCLEVLLNRGANPNIRSYPQSGSLSPLHLAACLGYEPCAKILLEKGSTPTLEDDLGQTPITIAKRFDTTDILPLLKEYTDLHKIFQWCKEPSKRPDIEQVLASDKTLKVNWPNGEKMTMLHVATIAQNLPVVELLLSHHADFDCADSYGNTPIDIANGTEKMPLNPPSKNEKIHQRFLQYRRINALTAFINSGSLPDVKRLLKEAPTEYNLHVDKGLGPLHMAAQRGFVAICKRLMKGGARVDFTTTDGKTPIHLAAESGKVDCLRMLLSDPSAKSVVNAGDAHGNTPLILCVRTAPETLEGVCEVLLSSGAEVEQKNRDGKTALDVSREVEQKSRADGSKNAFSQVLSRHRNGVEVIEAARRGDSKKIGDIFKGPDNEKPSADFQDINGKTALHYACASQEGETCVSILLRNGAHVEIRDREDKTPLDIIRSRQHTERTQRLLTQYAAGIQVSICAISGQKQRMQQLLTKFNIDVDFCDQIEMKTPLHWACLSGKGTCVEYLLNQGATVDVKDKNSETPLFLAVRNGHKDIIEVLLERGANPEISDACGDKLVESICDYTVREKDQVEQGLGLFAVLHLFNINIGVSPDDVKKQLQELFERLENDQITLKPEIRVLLSKHINGRKFVEELAGKGDLARMREMYIQYPDILNYRSAGETALHHAVRKGYVDLVEDLLEQGASVTMKNNAKKTPIDIANEMMEKEGKHKASKILELLYRYGCGPEVIAHCKEGKDNALQALLEANVPLGFNVDYKMRGDFTGLHIAAANGHLSCMEILFKYNAAPDKQDADGYTPLHYAARYGKEEEVKRLLDAGVDVEQRNDQGLTPLMMAAIGEHNKCLQILTTFGAQVNVQNNYKQTPLMLAILSGFTECVQMLLDNGANPNVIDASKNTALHYATIHGYVEIIKLLLATNKIDPNQENRKGHSPVIIATAKGNATLLSLLLGAKTTDPNYGSNITAIFVAIQHSNIECLKLLLEHGANPNKSVDGVTPLHRAVMIGDVTTVELLLSYDADPQVKSTFNISEDLVLKLTPLELCEVMHVLDLHTVPTQLLRCKAGANAIHEAIMKGEITALKQLLTEYDDADVINYQDREGKTPLHWACEKEYVSCIKALLVFYPNLTVKDKAGNVPMAVARKNGNEEVKKELQRYENATKLLKEASSGNESELKKIIDSGDVDLEFAKPDKNTAVHLCAAYGFSSCLQLLLNKAGHLANRPNLEKELPIHMAAERGHVACVQDLLPFTKPGGKVLHDEIWSLAIENEQRDLISWLHSDLCSHRELPTNLFAADIEIEYRLGDMVNFISVPADISFYDLEQKLYSKNKRYMNIEQRLEQGRAQLRDDADLQKAVRTAKEGCKGKKTVLVLHLTQNLENKPFASAPSAGDNASKPINKLRINTDTTSNPNKTNNAAPISAALSTHQFSQLKDSFEKSFKELEKEMKKNNTRFKQIQLQNDDIYDEIQNIKTNDRNFISVN